MPLRRRTSSSQSCWIEFIHRLKENTLPSDRAAGTATGHLARERDGGSDLHANSIILFFSLVLCILGYFSGILCILEFLVFDILDIFVVSNL